MDLISNCPGPFPIDLIYNCSGLLPPTLWAGRAFPSPLMGGEEPGQLEMRSIRNGPGQLEMRSIIPRYEFKQRQLNNKYPKILTRTLSLIMLFARNPNLWSKTRIDKHITYFSNTMGSKKNQQKKLMQFCKCFASSLFAICLQFCKYVFNHRAHIRNMFTILQTYCQYQGTYVQHICNLTHCSKFTNIEFDRK